MLAAIQGFSASKLKPAAAAPKPEGAAPAPSEIVHEPVTVVLSPPARPTFSALYIKKDKISSDAHVSLAGCEAVL
jgi:hypothetical protein